MFPIPKDMVSERVISSEPDAAYRSLLAQELRYCIKHQAEIQKLAERTYKRVLLGKDPGLVANSCAFAFLRLRFLKTSAKSGSRSILRKRSSFQTQRKRRGQSRPACSQGCIA